MAKKSLKLADALARAEALARKGKTSEAAALYRAVLAKVPDHTSARQGLAKLSARPTAAPGALMAQAQKHAAAGQTAKALALLEQARRLAPDVPEPANAQGIVLARAGRLSAAVECFAAAVETQPDFAEGHNNLATALRSLGRAEVAEDAARRAVELRPDVAAFRTTLGQVLGDLGQSDAALEALETALKEAPDFVAAHEAICRIHDGRNDLPGLGKAVERAETVCGAGSPVIALRRAQLLSREGRDGEVLEELEAMTPKTLPPELRTTFHMLLGRSADRLGRPEEAMAHFTRGNEAAMPRALTKPGAGNPYLQSLARRTDDAKSAASAPWTVDAGTGGGPVFLVGFPRSGTTLLDSALRGHSRISVIEERDTLRPVQTFLGNPETLADLKALPDDRLAAARDRYRAILSEEAGAPTPVVIDKMPLYLGEVALIHRLFPDARFVLSLRHPCDCVLSGFMQQFRSNAAMDNFLTLEGSALLYDRVMTLWTRHRDLFDLRVVEVRYEDLIADMGGTIAPILDFLECDWEEGVRDYRTTALARDRISTPSYRQVTKELYTDARNRWRRYETALSPHMALLEPWIAHWGYAD